MPSGERPRFADIDVWGLTHPGSVRSTNQDHFLYGALTRGVTVEGTSLGDGFDASVPRERLASLAVVADGVGSSAGGEHAARVAVEALVREVSRSYHDAQLQEATDSDVFARLLQDAALACHESLVRQAEREPEGGQFATALTLFLGLWPQAYLLQVGDTRCYLFQDGTLSQISRDQTVAQHLVDEGILSRTRAEGSRWANVLSSAIGGQEAAPVVTRLVRKWGAVVLLCSDGLTKHVSDDRIRERIDSMTNARQLCEDLLQEALDDGGSDNVTIVVGRTLPLESE